MDVEKGAGSKPPDRGDQLGADQRPPVGDPLNPRLGVAADADQVDSAMTAQRGDKLSREDPVSLVRHAGDVISDDECGGQPLGFLLEPRPGRRGIGLGQPGHARRRCLFLGSDEPKTIRFAGSAWLVIFQPPMIPTSIQKACATPAKVRYSAVVPITASTTAKAATAPPTARLRDSSERRYRQPATTTPISMSARSSSPTRPARKPRPRYWLSTKLTRRSGTSAGMTLPVPNQRCSFRSGTNISVQ